MLMALALFTQMSMPPKRSTACCTRRGDLVLVTDVADDRQRLPTRGLDLLGRRVHRALQLRVGLGGLRDQRHVRAVASGTHRDREPDPAASTRKEKGLACEIGRHRTAA